MDKAKRFLEILEKSQCPVEIEHRAFDAADARAILLAEGLDRLSIAIENGSEAIAKAIRCRPLGG